MNDSQQQSPMAAFKHSRALQDEAMEEARYVATINVPGYMPMDDEPPVFETAREAWDWLAEERMDAEEEDQAIEATTDVTVFTETVAELRAMAGTGTVYGSTPGYQGEHDLGLAYSVALQS